MAAQAKTTSSSTVGISDSMSTVFSSCRTLDVTDIEEGFSGNGVPSVFQYKAMSTERVGSDMRYDFVRSSMGYNGDACYLCKEKIHKDQEIYMYRGELPFCSPECRREQIEMDSALERLRQSQLKNQKGNFIPVDQIKCSMDSDSYNESGYRYFGYNVLRYIISLVVG